MAWVRSRWLSIALLVVGIGVCTASWVGVSVYSGSIHHLDPRLDRDCAGRPGGGFTAQFVEQLLLGARASGLVERGRFFLRKTSFSWEGWSGEREGHGPAHRGADLPFDRDSGHLVGVGHQAGGQATWGGGLNGLRL